MMEDLLNRISVLEREVGKLHQAPTIPVYDMSPPPPPPDWVLASNDPDIDNYTPALYYQFSPQTDVWLRSDCRSDKWNRFVSTPYIMLAFTEWTTDQAYFGDWWESGGFSWYPADTSQLTTWNVSGSNVSFISHGHPRVRVYDLHCTYLDDGFVHSPVNLSRWHLELWGDGVLQEEYTVAPNGDPHRWNFRSINAAVIFNSYGNQSLVSPSAGIYSGPVVYMDDISIGTSQGGQDILSNVDFSDGSFEPFVLDPGTVGSSVDSFQVLNIG